MVDKNSDRKSKRPSSEDIKGLLLEGNFGVTSDIPLPMTDPIAITAMVLKLKDIKPYDKNPRRERNPLYEEIKDSIRSKKGIDDKFNVTRRPGDDVYMIESGGNTRLLILNELYLETADEIFNTVHCWFKPWTSDSSLLTAHLIENDLRAPMILIDKAYATQEVRQEFEAEKGKEVSDREFTRMTAEAGYKVSPRTLRTFNYAVKLDQMIPLVMRSGIGRPKIDHIKKTEKAYLELCEDYPDQFEAAFMQVMSENDTEEKFDFDQVRNELDRLLETIIGLRSNIIYMKVNQFMDTNSDNHSDFPEPAPSIAQKSPNNEQSNAEIQEDSGSRRDEDKEGAKTSPNAPVDVEQQQTIDEIAPPPIKETANTVTKQKDKPRPDLKRLREKSYHMALKIAGKELEDTVMEASSGMGFLIETPQHPLLDYSQEEPTKTGRYYRWWLLFNLSGQTSGDSHFKCWMYLDIYRRLGLQQHKKETENEILQNHIGTPLQIDQMLHFSMLDEKRMSDTVFTDIFRLMESCRKIRQHFTEIELWSE